MKKREINFANRTFREHDLRIGEMLGHGNWSVVYQAMKLDNTQKYAVKVISENVFKKTPKMEQLTLAQINILKQCKSPNVVQFIKTFRVEDHLFTVLQFCNGGDLGYKLKQEETLSEHEAVNYLKQILQGFRGLHQIRAMHRDFKVENVMLHDDVCKIVDLGFGKQLKTGQDVTSTKLGSNLTMAPEVMRQEPYGFEADIWSIGVVFYQLLLGRFPFIGRGIPAILRIIENDELNFQGPDISDNAVDFIKKCLVVDPQKRISWEEIYKHPLIVESEVFSLVFKSQGSSFNVKENFSFYNKIKNKSSFKPSQISRFLQKQEEIEQQRSQIKESSKYSEIKNASSKIFSREYSIINESQNAEKEFSFNKNISEKQKQDKIRQQINNQIRSRNGFDENLSFEKKSPFQINHQNKNDSRKDIETKKLTIHQKWQKYRKQYAMKKYERSEEIEGSFSSENEEEVIQSKNIQRFNQNKNEFPQSRKDNFMKQQQRFQNPDHKGKKFDRIQKREKERGDCFRKQRQKEENTQSRLSQRQMKQLSQDYFVKEEVKKIKCQYLSQIKDSEFFMQILPRYREIKSTISRLNNAKYLCLLLKDCYMKLKSIHNKIVSNTRMTQNIQYFEIFNYLFKDELAFSLFQGLVVIEKLFKEYFQNVRREQLTQAEYIELNILEYPHHENWKLYLSEEIKSYWTQIGFLRFQFGRRNRILSYIFCLKNFEERNRKGYFAISHLFKLLKKLDTKRLEDDIEKEKKYTQRKNKTTQYHIRSSSANQHQKVNQRDFNHIPSSKNFRPHQNNIYLDNQSLPIPKKSLKPWARSPSRWF